MYIVLCILSYIIFAFLKQETSIFSFAIYNKIYLVHFDKIYLVTCFGRMSTALKTCHEFTQSLQPEDLT